MVWIARVILWAVVSTVSLPGVLIAERAFETKEYKSQGNQSQPSALNAQFIHEKTPAVPPELKWSDSWFEMERTADRVRALKNSTDVLGALSAGSLIFGGLSLGAMTLNREHDASFPMIILGGIAGGIGIIAGISAIGTSLAAYTSEKELKPTIFSSPVGEDNADLGWIDRPGNRLILSGCILSGVSVVAIATGAIFEAVEGHAQQAGSGTGYNLSTTGMLMIGSAYLTGVIASGFFAGGLVEARNAEFEKKIRLIPMLGLLKSGGAPNVNGAVAGISGQF